jgi:hypothetical protein
MKAASMKDSFLHFRFPVDGHCDRRQWRVNRNDYEKPLAVRGRPIIVRRSHIPAR